MIDLRIGEIILGIESLLDHLVLCANEIENAKLEQNIEKIIYTNYQSSYSKYHILILMQELEDITMQTTTFDIEKQRNDMIKELNRLFQRKQAAIDGNDVIGIKIADDKIKWLKSEILSLSMMIYELKENKNESV